MHHQLKWLTLLVSFAMLGGAGAAEDPARGWTLLFYLNADCRDGHAAVTPIVSSLAEYGSTERVQVVVLLDQGTVCTDVVDQPPFADARLFRVHRNHLELLPGVPPTSAQGGSIASSTAPPPPTPDPSMGNPQVLAWFVQEGLALAGDDHVALVSVGHGAPWRGLGADETVGNPDGSAEALSFAAFGLALQSVLAPMQRRLDLVALVHCNAGCMEAATAIAPFADWLLASEGSTDYGAVDPAALLRGLDAQTATADTAAEKLARLCLDLYEVSPINSGGAADGLSVVKCAEIDATVAALDDLGAVIAGQLAAGDVAVGDELRLAHALAYPFSCGSCGPCNPIGCDLSMCCMSDLRDLAEILSDSSNRAVAAAALCLKCRMDELVPGRDNPLPANGLGGLSIYLPCRAEELVAYETSAVALRTRWDEMLAEYLRVDCQDCSGDSLILSDVVVTSAPKGGASISATTDAHPVTAGHAWLRVIPAGDVRYAVTMPASVERVGSSARLRAEWGWSIAFVHGAPSPLPLAVAYPRPVRGQPGLYQGETLLRWRPVDSPPEEERLVYAQYVIDATGSAPVGWIRRLRPGPGSSESHTLHLKPGDGLALPPPAGEVVPAPSFVTITEVPVPVTFSPLREGIPARVGFSLRDGQGHLRTRMLPGYVVTHSSPVVLVPAMMPMHMPMGPGGLVPR